ncbi:Transposase [Streptococcus infantarius subsp. infantarius]|nr:Transposase [Streptococcus infantarius subsp. infantarius]
MKLKRRKDNNNRVLKDGEYQRTNGSYEYKWRDKKGKRHSVYAKTLNELRKKESSLLKDSITGINCNEKITIDDLFNKWKTLKRGLKDNTFQNYQYLYELFISESIGKITITNLKKKKKTVYTNHHRRQLTMADTTDNQIQK